MFRKPKRSAKKAGTRKISRDDDDEAQDDDQTGAMQRKAADSDSNDDGDDHPISSGLEAVRKRAKLSSSSKKSNVIANKKKDISNLLNPNQMAPTEAMSQKEKATATNEYHPVDMGQPDPNRNKFLAQPIKAPTNVRVTCRFDYQPDICKDYKDTGFCGFGDTCIYLHDRGDTMAGWQLDQKWEQEQAKKKQEKDRQIEAFLSGGDAAAGDEDDDDDAAADDDLPFACFLCRKAFDDPIVTTCGHYFCQSCLHQHNQQSDNTCPICKKDTHGVMNQPTKLIKQKRKILGRKATWEEFMEHAKKKRDKPSEE
jgi:RING finger protein 113A